MKFDRSILVCLLLVVGLYAGCKHGKPLATSTSTLPSGRVVTASSDTGTVSMYHDADICYIDLGITKIVIEPTVITVDGEKIPKRLDRFSNEVEIICQDNQITISSGGLKLCDVNFFER